MDRPPRISRSSTPPRSVEGSLAWPERLLPRPAAGPPPSEQRAGKLLIWPRLLAANSAIPGGDRRWTGLSSTTSTPSPISNPIVVIPAGPTPITGGQLTLGSCPRPLKTQRSADSSRPSWRSGTGAQSCPLLRWQPGPDHGHPSCGCPMMSCAAPPPVLDVVCGICVTDHPEEVPETMSLVIGDHPVPGRRASRPARRARCRRTVSPESTSSPLCPGAVRPLRGAPGRYRPGSSQR